MKRKLLLAMLCIVGALGMRAQSWTAPTIAGEDPVSGEQYKVMNVGASKYLDMGKSWFGWSTTAILSDNGINFTMTADGDNWKFIRTGTQGVFTSGNEIPGDAMHVDNTAHTYSITKLANGYYHIHDVGQTDNCWGYEFIAKTGGQAQRDSWGVVAHSNITTIGEYGEWIFVTDLTLAVYKARLNLYNLLTTAASEGADTDAASTVYNNASATVDELNAAYAELNISRMTKFLEGKTADKENPIDITEYVLVNPDFEVATANGQMPPGWTITIGGANCGQQNRTDTNEETGLAITNFIEAWHWSAITSGVIAQTVTSLPEGTYVLECDASVCHDPASGDGTDITGAYLFIKSSLKTEQEPVGNVRLGIKHYSVSFSHGGEGEVQFGLKATDAINANWLSADNFKIFYAGPMDLSVYQDLLNEAVATFDAKESSLDAAVFAHLKDMVDDQNGSYSLSADYKTAISNVNAINDYADVLVAANAVDPSAMMNAEVLSALQTEIGKASTITLEAIADAVTPLTTATNNATTSVANYAAVKAAIDQANTNSATLDADGQAAFDISAIETAYSNRTITNDDYTTYLANITTAIQTAAKSQTTPGSDMSLAIVNPGIDGNANGWTTDINANGGYVGGPMKPSNDAMEFWGAGTTSDQDKGKSFDYYQTITGLPDGIYTISADMLNSTNVEEGADWNGGGKAGLYGKTATAEVKTLVTTDGESFLPYTTDEIIVLDGELRIGVKNFESLTGRWFACDNFKLTYVGPVAAKMTVKASKWGTFIAPFAVEIPAGINAYTVTGVNDNGYMVKTAVETTIPANTPVVLENTTSTDFEETFNGKSLAEEYSYTVGALTGVYTAATIPASEGNTINYVLQTQEDVQAFYKVTSDFTAVPNRCYLTVEKTNEAAPRAIFFGEDGDATGIQGVDGQIAKGKVKGIYSANGTELNQLQKGLNIVKMADGKVKKVYVK